MMNSVSSDSTTSDSEFPKAPKKAILDEFIKFGYFYIPFMFYQQLMVLVLTSSFLFTTFGSRLPAISKCGEENFESIHPTKQCKHLEEIHASGSNCTPVFNNDFWSLPQELNYYCDTAYIVKRATTIQMIGQFVGECIAGQLSDMFGRKKILIAGIVGMLGSLIGVSFTADLIWYSVAMFFMAVFSSYLVTVDTAYFVEMVPQKHVIWGFMFIGFSPNVIVFAGLAWISHDFRTLARVCAGITAALLVMQIWCPESARWLLQKRQLEDAKNVVKRIHKWNRTLTMKKSIELDLAFFKEGHEIAYREERENEINPNSRKKFYFYHLFLTSTMIKQILTMCFMYTTFYLGYYALVFNMELLPGNVFINTAIMGASRWVINILYGIVDIKYSNIGRKPTTSGIIKLALFFCLVVAVMAIFEIQIAFLTAVCFIVMGALSSHIFIIVGVVAGEVFPTPVRNGAIGMVHFFGRIGLIIAPLFFHAFDFYPPAAFILIFVLFIVGHVLFELFVPETKGVPLNDKMPDENEWLWGKRA
uniref:MFS domain-containing protein n=1 Tax=Panagrellus redivivus TaxID=6233 RepID=A0A7E4UM69_PANRE